MDDPTLDAPDWTRTHVLWDIRKSELDQDRAEMESATMHDELGLEISAELAALDDYDTDMTNEITAARERGEISEREYLDAMDDHAKNVRAMLRKLFRDVDEWGY